MITRKFIIFTIILLSASCSIIKTEEYCLPYEKNCTDYPETDEPIDCDQCCAQGRFASEECLRRCNGCLMRNDQATSEYNDWPYSH